MKWNENEIVFWFKYKLKWFETSILHSNNTDNDDLKEDKITSELLAIDFDKILTNLEKQKIRGKFLSVLNKSDLNNLGFELMKHKLLIYKNIKNLILKYPIPPDIDDWFAEMEGQAATDMENDNNNQIDEKYICPLSKLVMKDPIIASNGITYERSALKSYLKQHHQMPDSDAILSDIDDEMENWFVDDDIIQAMNKRIG